MTFVAGRYILHDEDGTYHTSFDTFQEARTCMPVRPPMVLTDTKTGEQWRTGKALVAVDTPKENLRRYTHEGCCAFNVPLDDSPLPECKECPNCAAWLPCVKAAT
jgi:hypothetical protein